MTTSTTHDASRSARPARRPHRLLGLARAELTLLRRNRMQLLVAVLLPLTVPFLYLPLKDSGFGPEQLASSLGTMMIVALLFVVYFNLVSTYVARRESLVLKRLRTGEARDATVLCAAAVPAVLLALVMVGLMIAIAIPLLDLSAPRQPLLPLAAVCLGIAVLVPLALATSSITRTVESAQITVLPFMAIAVIGAGAALPVDLLPAAAQRLIAVTPTAPMVELTRMGWLGVDSQGDPISGKALWIAAARQAAIMALWIAIGVSLVRRRFRWEPRT